MIRKNDLYLLPLLIAACVILLRSDTIKGGTEVPFPKDSSNRALIVASNDDGVLSDLRGETLSKDFADLKEKHKLEVYVVSPDNETLEGFWKDARTQAVATGSLPQIIGRINGTGFVESVDVDGLIKSVEDHCE